jgi:hypothetical protein
MGLLQDELQNLRNGNCQDDLARVERLLSRVDIGHVNTSA